MYYIIAMYIHQIKLENLIQHLCENASILYNNTSFIIRRNFSYNKQITNNLKAFIEPGHR